MCFESTLNLAWSCDSWLALPASQFTSNWSLVLPNNALWPWLMPFELPAVIGQRWQNNAIFFSFSSLGYLLLLFYYYQLRNGPRPASSTSFLPVSQNYWAGISWQDKQYFGMNFVGLLCTQMIPYKHSLRGIHSKWIQFGIVLRVRCCCGNCWLRQ